MTRVYDKGTSQAKSMYVGSAIDDSDLDVYEFRVYAHLKRRAQDGVVWEKQEAMAAICKMGRKKLNQALISLEEKKWIEQQARTYKGQQTTNLIFLLEPPCVPQTHGRVPLRHTAVCPTDTAKGIPHQGTPQQASRQDENSNPEKQDATAFFTTLAGATFVSRNKNRLARWYEDYSEAFLSLAWKLAPNVPNVRVASQAFVWLLDREKTWPAELTKAYSAPRGPETLGDEYEPRPGDMVEFDGRACLVLDVDAELRKCSVQTGADETEAVQVPYSAVKAAS
jgi:hypothetical protein